MSEALSQLSRPRQSAWRAARYFNLYRMVVAGLFLVLIMAESLPPPLGVYDRLAFMVTTILYLVGAVLAQFAMEYRPVRFAVQVFGQMLLDICAVTMMMYASGGVTSGFGMLLVVSIAGGSILTGGRLAVLYAAMAAIAVLVEEFYFWAYFYFPASNYTHAGLLGASFFATAVLGQLFARRIKESEALAEQTSLDLQNLAELNEHIVQRMQSGILVLDPEHNIRLVNLSALHLMGLEQGVEGRPLVDVAPELANLMSEWRLDQESSTRLFRTRADVEVWASFTSMGDDDVHDTLVFLEDALLMRQRGQQLKLASLGRLTASIAHEIRNPLGAISHAGQLLSESENLGETDRRMTGIIRDHSKRVNAIIENILQIGKRESSVPQELELTAWLSAFVTEFTERKGVEAGEIEITAQSDEIMVRMDPVQLHQVIWNLAENGYRHSVQRPRLTFSCGIQAETRRPYLDVADTGKGMPGEVEEQIFEPFFTNDAGGTGLGLYISRELCEGNQASLVLLNNNEEGCVFRVIFAHPDRQQIIME